MAKELVLPICLGIEGGGTRTVALLAQGGQLLQRAEFGPANIKLMNDAELLKLLRRIGSAFPQIESVAIGLAGARGEAEWQRIRQAGAKIWPGIPCHATHDLATALAAEDAIVSESRSKPIAPGISQPVAKVLVLSGTGSCCFGTGAGNRTAKIGGWGHILGDKGSAFEIGLRALKAVVYYHDCDREWPRLGERLLRRLLLNEPEQLIDWVRAADKATIAGLAMEVFDAWHDKDEIARDILAGAAHSLAKDAVSCARQLARASEPVKFVLAGGTLLRQPRFARLVSRHIREQWKNSLVTPLKRESAWGAVVLAQQQCQAVFQTTQGRPKSRATKPALEVEPKGRLIPESTGPSPTEERNPASMKLDRMPFSSAIRLMLAEEAKVASAVLAEERGIEKALRFISTSFQQGERLFYVGAGTSGRLGVLDASECPPTFRTSPEMVQGIIAGGREALWLAVEGAEDDYEAGGRAVAYRGVRKGDVVVGIAASGRTPFVWGALAGAKLRGARTVFVCFNPNLKIAPNSRPDVVIAPKIGPEVLTGSTRLKAGTATKVILNIFTTLAMTRQGKVISNLMVDVNPSNVKLRDRAVRILQLLTGKDAAVVRQSLERNGWVIKLAWKELKGAGSGNRSARRASGE